MVKTKKTRNTSGLGLKGIVKDFLAIKLYVENVIKIF